MNRTARAVFDVDRFIADVKRYCHTHSISGRKLAEMADVDLSTALGILRGEHSLTLLSAASFAYVCDLSLDEYRT